MTEAFDVGSGEAAKIDEITGVPRPSRNRLEEQTSEDYGEHGWRLINWMVHLGQNPENGVDTPIIWRETEHRVSTSLPVVWEGGRVLHDHGHSQPRRRLHEGAGVRRYLVGQ